MTAAPPKGTKLALLGSLALAVAGGAAFVYASQQKPARSSNADQTVRVSATSCEPNAISVPGGRRSFDIVNVSDRTIEWEILNGVMVVAERENIAPGFTTTLEVQLAPGDYAMTCGLLSNPRGTLTVTPSDEASAAAANLTLRQFLGPLSEYKVYLTLQGNQAVKAAEALRDSIASGDVAAAQEAWRQARLPYRRIEPLAHRLSDLERRIDPLAAYLEARETDPEFSGYHRLEHQLFAKNSVEGLEPVADQLVTDLTALVARLKEMPLDPQLLIALPGEMSAQIATGQVPAGENLYAGNDLQELSASLDGIGKLSGLLAQALGAADPELARQIDQQLQKMRTDLDQIAATSPATYADVSAAQKKQLGADLTTFAETLARVQPVVGGN